MAPSSTSLPRTWRSTRRRVPHRWHDARVAICCALLTAAMRWARATTSRDPAAQARFWYVSEEKLEPRLGERAQEPGADLEQPLAVARDVARARSQLLASPARRGARRIPAAAPEHRHTARRVQIAARYPYGGDPRQPDRRRHAAPSTCCAASWRFSASRASTRSRTNGCASRCFRVRLSPTRSRAGIGTAGSGARRGTSRHDRVAQRDRKPVPQGGARGRHELGSGRGSVRRGGLACGARLPWADTLVGVPRPSSHDEHAAARGLSSRPPALARGCARS